MNMKRKIDKNRKLIHRLHIYTREINIAYKFLLFIKISNKPPDEQLELAN